MSALKKTDPRVFRIIQQEEKRQQEKLSMIASENFFSPAVREAVGSVFSHKYAEGNVGARYYEGNQHIDELESVTIERAKKVFCVPKTWSANVQALSGANANLAVYLALLDFGDVVMSMYLPDGGHLSHGWKANITAKMYQVIQYKTSQKTKRLDYREIETMARRHQPKLLIAGGSAYPRNIDYRRLRKIADSVKAYLMVDIAHEAGLVAAGVLPSPVGIADVVTMTTHKTLRAGRGAIILAHQDLIKKINRAILPGLQGGPHNHNIAGICVGLGEALKPSFKRYAKQVIKNAQTLAQALQRQKFTLVSGGTDKHLVLVDLSPEPLLGKKFARALDYAGIVANCNTIPYDPRGPADPSGLRLGTPWLTTRGMKEREMKQIAAWIRAVMNIASQWQDLDFKAFNKKAEASRELAKISRAVKKLCRQFPLDVTSR